MQGYIKATTKSAKFELRLKTLLPQDMQDLDLWYEENSEPNQLTIKNQDMGETVINITRTYNEYGTAFYELTLETFSNDDEIETSEALAQHEHELGYYEEEEELTEEQQQQKEEEAIKEIDNNAQTKKQQWLNRKKWDYSTTYRQYLTIESIIKDHYCYVNVPHYHYFQGYKLTFKSQDYQEIKAMLTLYDKLLNLYEANIRWILN